METLQRTANRGSVSTGYNVANGCAFDATRSEKMTKTPTSAGNRRTFTISFWHKRGGLNTKDYIFEAGNSDADADRFTLRWGTGNTLDIQTSATYLITNRLFRDVSAWYHVVLAVDTTDGTASNRMKLYVNGVAETSFSTDNRGDINQNFDFAVNNTKKHIIGNSDVEGSNFLDGNLCEFVILDGTAAAPTAFGEFDEDSGIWKPIDVSGLTFGTNGCYLDFEDSSNMGNDANGGLDFTESNINATDQSQDTCTNNFATWNFNTGSTEGNVSGGFSGGNLIRQGVNGSFNACVATMGINPYIGTASWYWELEITVDNDGNSIECIVGWVSENILNSDSHATGAVVSAGFAFNTSTNWDPPAEGTGAAGDIFSMHLQCDSSNPTFKWFKNDTLVFTDRNAQHTIDNCIYFPYGAAFKNTMEAVANFGNPIQEFAIDSGNSDPDGHGTFEFATKSGFALCTKNLAEYAG